MIDGTRINFAIPSALTGCNLHLAARGNQVRAWTWLTLTKGRDHVIHLPLSVLGDTAQDAVNRLGQSAAEARREVLSSRAPD